MASLAFWVNDIWNFLENHTKTYFLFAWGRYKYFLLDNYGYTINIMQSINVINVIMIMFLPISSFNEPSYFTCQRGAEEQEKVKGKLSDTQKAALDAR